MSFFRALFTSGATTTSVADASQDIIAKILKEFPIKYELATGEKINKDTEPFNSIVTLIKNDYSTALKTCLSEVFNTDQLREWYQLKTTEDQRLAFRSAIASAILDTYIVAGQRPIASTRDFNIGRVQENIYKPSYETKQLDENFKETIRKLATEHLNLPSLSFTNVPGK